MHAGKKEILNNLARDEGPLGTNKSGSTPVSKKS